MAWHPKSKQLRRCRQKVRYYTVEAAEFFASTVNNRVYVCPVCRWWHTTSQQEPRGSKTPKPRAGVPAAEPEPDQPMRGLRIVKRP